MLSREPDSDIPSVPHIEATAEQRRDGTPSSDSGRSRSASSVEVDNAIDPDERDEGMQTDNVVDPDERDESKQTDNVVDPDEQDEGMQSDDSDAIFTSTNLIPQPDRIGSIRSVKGIKGLTEAQRRELVVSLLSTELC